ncbi:hypothetical protein GCM10023175_71380 [Pseudonocardia xishanensis]|uniref:Uncharacterized protein n=1 Tax=Pseudonocardia xishanensis TaxID=630995 RepID=A0ABP8S4F3_9PSEU
MMVSLRIITNAEPTSSQITVEAARVVTAGVGGASCAVMPELQAMGLHADLACRDRRYPPPELIGYAFSPTADDRAHHTR